MASIVDDYNNELAEITNSVIPSFSGVTIENRLLNGTIHIQTIGDSTNEAVVQAICTYEQSIFLSKAAVEGIKIYVDFEDIYFDGLILGSPSVRLFSRGPRSTRLYEASFRMYVEGVG